MRRLVASLLIGLAGIAVGTFAGIAVGQDMIFSQLEAEVARTLSFHVQVLGRLRDGRAEQALEMLEASVTNAIVTLPQGRPVPELPEQTKTALGRAKAYRTAYDPDVPDTQEANSILDQIRIPPAVPCKPPPQ